MVSRVQLVARDPLDSQEMQDVMANRVRLVQGVMPGLEELRARTDSQAQWAALELQGWWALKALLGSLDRLARWDR
jgi:hypothetical protein